MDVDGLEDRDVIPGGKTDDVIGSTVVSADNNDVNQHLSINLEGEKKKMPLEMIEPGHNSSECLEDHENRRGKMVTNNQQLIECCAEQMHNRLDEDPPTEMTIATTMETSIFAKVVAAMRCTMRDCKAIFGDPPRPRILNEPSYTA